MKFITALTLSETILIGGFLLIALAFSPNASAEEPPEQLPSEFYMDYTPDVELVLGYDQFDKSDISMGWMATAHDKSQNRTATGRWYYSPDETVTIHISLGINPKTGGEEFLDYRLFKSKFTPRYNK
jgi:hypothetical protein